MLWINPIASMYKEMKGSRPCPTGHQEHMRCPRPGPQRHRHCTLRHFFSWKNVTTCFEHHNHGNKETNVASNWTVLESAPGSRLGMLEGEHLNDRKVPHFFSWMRTCHVFPQGCNICAANFLYCNHGSPLETAMFNLYFLPLSY